MTEEIITLSQTELDRALVMQPIINRDLTQAQAAQQLKLSIPAGKTFNTRLS